MPSDEKVTDEPWTIGRLLAWTTDFLEAWVGEPSARCRGFARARARPPTRAALHTL